MKIIIVSNRGPFSFTTRDGKTIAIRGAGGLVTAISAVARQHDVLWISCALSQGDRDYAARVGDSIQVVENMKVRLVVPDAVAFHSYYNVISNSLLWFIQHQMHDTPRYPLIDESVWHGWEKGYAAINQQLAEAVAASITDWDEPVVVMPQDYHLYLFPRFLRDLVGDKAIIQPFLHIPFPGSDAWRVLPLKMRQEMLEAMLCADRLGFQTERDTRRFLQTVAATFPNVKVLEPWRRIAYGGREVAAAPYPISIDGAYMQKRRDGNKVQRYVRQFRAQYKNRKLIVRIDRVEPSKNILRGFIAFRNLILARPEYRRRVCMLALLVPSRVDVPEYKTYLRDIMALVGEINATLGDSDWEPIRVFLGDNYDQAIAAMSAYDVLLVNPVADGMNLVAKEGAVLNQRDGVVVLSEEAGVAEEFGDATLLLSPYDVYGTQEALHQALTMNPEERHARAQRLATYMRDHDIYRWFDEQVADAAKDADTKRLLLGDGTTA